MANQNKVFGDAIAFKFVCFLIGSGTPIDPGTKTWIARNGEKVFNPASPMYKLILGEIQKYFKAQSYKAARSQMKQYIRNNVPNLREKAWRKLLGSQTSGRETSRPPTGKTPGGDRPVSKKGNKGGQNNSRKNENGKDSRVPESRKKSRIDYDLWEFPDRSIVSESLPYRKAKAFYKDNLKIEEIGSEKIPSVELRINISPGVVSNFEVTNLREISRYALLNSVRLTPEERKKLTSIATDAREVRNKLPKNWKLAALPTPQKEYEGFRTNFKKANERREVGIPYLVVHVHPIESYSDLVDRPFGDVVTYTPFILGTPTDEPLEDNYRNLAQAANDCDRINFLKPELANAKKDSLKKRIKDSVLGTDFSRRNERLIGSVKAKDNLAAAFAKGNVNDSFHAHKKFIFSEYLKIVREVVNENHTDPLKFKQLQTYYNLSSISYGVLYGDSAVIIRSAGWLLTQDLISEDTFKNLAKIDPSNIVETLKKVNEIYCYGGYLANFSNNGIRIISTSCGCKMEEIQSKLPSEIIPEQEVLACLVYCQTDFLEEFSSLGYLDLEEKLPYRREYQTAYYKSKGADALLITPFQMRTKEWSHMDILKSANDLLHFINVINYNMYLKFLTLDDCLKLLQVPGAHILINQDYFVNLVNEYKEKTKLSGSQFESARNVLKFRTMEFLLVKFIKERYDDVITDENAQTKLDELMSELKLPSLSKPEPKRDLDRMAGFSVAPVCKDFYSIFGEVNDDKVKEQILFQDDKVPDIGLVTASLLFLDYAKVDDDGRFYDPHNELVLVVGKNGTINGKPATLELFKRMNPLLIFFYDESSIKGSGDITIFKKERSPFVAFPISAIESTLAKDLEPQDTPLKTFTFSNNTLNACIGRYSKCIKPISELSLKQLDELILGLEEGEEGVEPYSSYMTDGRKKTFLKRLNELFFELENEMFGSSFSEHNATSNKV